MTRLFKLLASAALGLWLALTAITASAVNPIYNPDFKLISADYYFCAPFGWTITPFVSPRGQVGGSSKALFCSDVADTGPEYSPYFTHDGTFSCQPNCPRGPAKTTLSQTLTGLEQNKQYAITFWLSGYSVSRDRTGFVTLTTPPPFYVSLGRHQLHHQ